MDDHPQPPKPDAEQVRAAVIRAFEQAYEEAGLRGLCPEGRYEAAIDAARSVELPG